MIHFANSATISINILTEYIYEMTNQYNTAQNIKYFQPVHGYEFNMEVTRTWLA